MDAAMNVGVFLLVVAGYCVEYNLRLLRGRSVIEIYEFLAAHITSKDREVPANFLNVVPGLCCAKLGGAGQVSCCGHPISSPLRPRSSVVSFARFFVEFAILSK